uniref:Uncharacterized protein n=1 Tax=Anguilla anguilla TaxID=7936 RepID=A0A0E9Q977_ANGAN
MACLARCIEICLPHHPHPQTDRLRCSHVSH